MAALNDEIARTMRHIPETIKNGPIFDEIRNVSNQLPIYRSCLQMKCVFFGKSNTGKSTILNALTKRDFLPMGETDVTNSFFTIEKTSKDHEYFVVTNRKSGLTANESTNIHELKNVKRLNYNVTDFPDIDTILKIYLDNENEFLNEGVVFVDCPGYNRGHFETIKDLSKDADVFTVVIDITQGCSEIEAGNVKQIIQISENGPICFIFNKCENISPYDKEKARDDIKKHFPSDSNSANSEKPVFFLCANKLFPRIPDEYNDEEFEKYKRYLQKQKLIFKLSHKNGCITLASRIKELADKIEESVTLITNKQYRNIEKTKQSRMKLTSSLPDTQIKEILEKIDQIVDVNNSICHKNDADLKVVKICDEVNKMISEFLKQLCLSNNEVITIKDGFAIRKADETFYKTVFVASEMKINNYKWYNSGEKTAEVQRNFKTYVSTHESKYKEIITSHYKEKVDIFLDNVLLEREEYIEYMEALESLVTQLQQST